MNRTTTLKIGAALGGLAVALGAFAAHALKPMLLESGRLETFELAVRYQFYHALSLLVVGLIMKEENPVRFLKFSSWSFLVGCILFSGSLYLLCLTGITGFAVATPFGGVSLIFGWTFLFLGIGKI